MARGSSIATWRVSSPPLSVIRRPISARVTTSPASTHTDHSVLELNGRHVALRLFFSSRGPCATQSLAIFPTRMAAPDNPRGYLQSSLPFPDLPAPPTRIVFDGTSVRFEAESPLYILRIFVSPDLPVVSITLETPNAHPAHQVLFPEHRHGAHVVHTVTHCPSPHLLHIALIAANADSVPSSPPPPSQTLARRQHLVSTWTTAITLQCPDPLLTAFHHFAKIRCCEAVFNAPKLGTVHSPGGGMFYCGVWCNDQAEYAAAVLTMLGGTDRDSGLSDAAVNSLHALAGRFGENGPDDIPYSIEVDGGYVGRLDRGDAAMFAWGASQVILLRGDPAITQKLLPGVRFAADVLLRRADAHGIIPSQSDELEGRFPTGDANLATNCLSVLALFAAGEVFKLGGDMRTCRMYQSAAERVRAAADIYFGRAGVVPYAYFDECETPRGWVALAALAELPHGRESARAALTTLWDDEAPGVRVAADAADVWDRQTAYAIRGALRGGSDDVALGLRRWVEFATARVEGRGAACPYAVETASDAAQLAAESALVVRIVTDGLLGLEPLANGLRVRPSCPNAWKEGYSVKDVWFRGVRLAFEVARRGNEGIAVVVTWHGGKVEREVDSGASVIVRVNGDGDWQTVTSVEADCTVTVPRV